MCMYRPHQKCFHRYSLEDVLNELRGTGLEGATRTKLELAYCGFKRVYDVCLSRTRTKLEHMSQERYDADFDHVLGADLAQLAAYARKVSSKPPCAAVMEILLALVLAWWSLEGCKSTMDSLRRQGKAFLKQPHPAQLLALFRILGVAGSSDDIKVNGNPATDLIENYFEFDTQVSAPSALNNHMVEIKTGEGTFDYRLRTVVEVTLHLSCPTICRKVRYPGCSGNRACTARP